MQEMRIPLTESIVPGIIEGRYDISNYGYIVDNNTGEEMFVNTGVMVELHTTGNAKSCVAVLNVIQMMYELFNNTKVNTSKYDFSYIDGHKNNHRLDNITIVPSTHVVQHFNANALANANLPFQEMSRKNFYQNPKGNKVLVYYANEAWKELVGIPTARPWYMVSNFGRVYSKASDSIIKPSIINAGYIRIQLRSFDNNKIDTLVHRLVAMAYVYNDDPVVKTEVNHIDSNPFNNQSTNLEWITTESNQQLKTHISRYSYSYEYFPEEVIREICKALEAGKDYRWICANVLHTRYDAMLHKRINRIHKHNAHTNISCDYNF